MAATISSPWGKPGAWALDAEEHESELLQQKEAANDTAEFPSLAAAAAAKPKKKKGQTISLAEFTTYGSAKTTQPEEPLVLPTGPRQRSAEELDHGRLGGGFRNYGANRYGDDSSKWGSSRSTEEGRRTGGFGRDANRESLPSRADEIDNWAAAKKPSFGFERRERDRERGGFFDSHSKADEVDNWVSTKTDAPRRFGGFDRDNRRGPRGGFDSDADNWGKKKDESNNGDGVSSNGRPRLVLQPRTLPVNEKVEETVKPKGSSPFGEARPREEVLREKGQDWKEIDEKLESVKIKEKDVKMEREGSFEKRGFGLRDGRGISAEDKTERTWRKPEPVDEPPQSAEDGENGASEQNEAEIDINCVKMKS